MRRMPRQVNMKTYHCFREALKARQSTIQTFKIKENRLRSSKSRLDSYSVNAYGMSVFSEKKVTNKSYEEGEKRGSGR